MNFIIKKTNFLQPIQKLNHIISVNHEKPIINNILLIIKENNVFLISTNLEMEFITKITCIKIYQNGKAVIPGKKLLNIIHSFPNDSAIQVSINNNHIRIFYKNIYFILNIFNAKHFPIFEKEKKTIKFHISHKKFKNIIYNTHFCIANQDIRNYLNGIYIKIKKNKIYAIATDGYRMAISKINIQTIKKIPKIIIPKKTILELIKLLDNTDKILHIIIGQKTIKFYINQYIISSKLIDNEFPNYKNLLIKKFNTIIQINRDLLYQALNRASILVHKKFQGIKLHLNNGKCTISTKNENNDQVREKFAINYYHTPIELTLNINYILDVIKMINNDTIKISLSKHQSSIYIENNQESNSLYIIMPLIL